MAYRKIEQIFTEEEVKLLNSFIEDEDYTVLDADIIEKLVNEEEEEKINRTCTNSYWNIFIDWVYSWFG